MKNYIEQSRKWYLIELYDQQFDRPEYFNSKKIVKFVIENTFYREWIIIDNEYYDIEIW